jgi:hypothetical protein
MCVSVCVCVCVFVCVCVKCIVYVHVVGQGNSGLEYSQAQEVPALQINCNRRPYVCVCKPTDRSVVICDTLR